MDKSARINKFINITLLVFVVLVCSVYVYMVLPTFFKEEVDVPVTETATSTPITEEEKREVMQEVTDSVEVDEEGLLKMLNVMPQKNTTRNLSEKEKMNILEGI